MVLFFQLSLRRGKTVSKARTDESVAPTRQEGRASLATALVAFCLTRAMHVGDLSSKQPDRAKQISGADERGEKRS